MDITRDVMRGTAAGKSPATLRAEVDARYGKFGAPTPTPRP